MAECKLTGAFKAPDCADKFSEPGIKKDKIFFANFSEVTLTKDANNQVTGVSFDTYKGFICATSHKDTTLWSEELAVAQNAGSFYNQTVTMRTIEKSNDTRGNIEDMVDTDVIVFLQEKNGRIVVLGETGGLQLTENTAGSGATSGDDTGDLLTFTGTNNGKYLISTMTIAAIEALVIA